MVILTREYAAADLEQYRERLVTCLQTAIQDFLADNGAALAFMRRGTQASLVRDYIVRNIRAEFPNGQDGITHSERRGLFLLNIKNRYALRFKMLDRRFRTRNIPTQLSLDFLLQQPMVLFPDLDAVMHLNVGYQRGLTLATSTYWITCPNGDHLEWKLSISPAEPTYLPDPEGKPKELQRPAAARAREQPAASVDGSAS